MQVLTFGKCRRWQISECVRWQDSEPLLFRIASLMKPPHGIRPDVSTPLLEQEGWPKAGVVVRSKWFWKVVRSIYHPVAARHPSCSRRGVDTSGPFFNSSETRRRL